MSPLIIFGLPIYADDDPDPEPCSLCGNPTVQLAFVRVEELLLGFCAACCSALNGAHAHMSAQRIARNERARG